MMTLRSILLLFSLFPYSHFLFFFFFFNDTATTEIYTLSLHDALPIFFAVECAHTRAYQRDRHHDEDRKSTRLNSSHVKISYAVFCLKKKKKKYIILYILYKKNLRGLVIVIL